MENILDSDFQTSDDLRQMDFDKVTTMLKDAYWSKGIGLAEVKQGADNSALVVGAFTPDKTQVGYARVISDRTRFAYILDVYVDENFRKKGIGKGMIQFILNHPKLKDVYQWFLATRDAHNLYKKFGFVPLTNAERWMEIRKPEPRYNA